MKHVDERKKKKDVVYANNWKAENFISIKEQKTGEAALGVQYLPNFLEDKGFRIFFTDRNYLAELIELTGKDEMGSQPASSALEEDVKCMRYWPLIGGGQSLLQTGRAGMTLHRVRSADLWQIRKPTDSCSFFFQQMISLKSREG